MKLKATILSLLILITWDALNAQDTTIVSTLNYQSATRDTVVEFPDGNESYRKILMLYNMRCKGARVSTGSNRNLGCGEWDYSCNTYITDSSRRDSFLSSTPEFTVSNFNGTTYNYSTQAIYDYFQTRQYRVNINSTTSENTYNVGTSSSPLPLFSTSPQKIYLLYTQTELTAGGIAPGDINAINFNLSNNGLLKNLRISLAATTADSLSSAPNQLDFVRNYQKSAVILNGTNRFHFHNPFTWDGTSNIVIELSHQGATTGINAMHYNGLKYQSMGSVNGEHTFLNGQTYFEAGTYKGILGSADRTIDAWIKTTQANGEICSWGTDRAGEKWVFRVNGNGELRVEVNGGNIIGTKKVNDGKWHHVACVLAGTQVSDVKLYLDGVQEAISSTANRAINTTSGINTRISRGVNNRYFLGEMDELRIWSTALTAAEINEMMTNKVTSGHSLYSSLQAYFPFNNADVLVDSSMNNRNLVLFGDEYKKGGLARNIPSAYQLSQSKPYLELVRGVYNVTIDSSLANLDSLVKSFNVVKQFKVYPKYGAISNDSIATLVDDKYWDADVKSFYSDEYGNLYDSAAAVKSGTFILNNSLPYYRRYPSSLEIMSFVTPYGIGLDLGQDGKTWVFDVTDFTPILKGKKRMFLSRGGQWQEEMDIKFLFIKGTPEREVKDIIQLWPTSFVTANYNQILANTNYFPPLRFPVSNEHYKIRSAITGHGQQGEFIPRNHSIMVENQTYSRQVWKECAENPVYPQGGTWIYDRAGWCPGMATDVAEYNVTDLAKGKDSITIDYTIADGSGDSRYIINNQIVTYGDWKNKLDASVVDIISPSLRVEYQRENPSCVSPKVKIRNTGSDTLTFVKLQYWVNNKTHAETDVWHGNLAPGQEAIHPFPVNQKMWLSATGTNDRFYATVLQVNGVDDNNAANNTAVSDFVLPDMVPNHIILFMRGNNAGAETSVKITDDWGQVIYSRNALGNNQLYRDTVRLGTGCHKLSVKDSDDDGISFWANSDGSGFVRILKVGGGYNKILQGDHGDGIDFNFTVNHQLSTPKNESDALITCYPNPSTGLVYLDGNGLEMAHIQVFNSLGQEVTPKINQTEANAALNFSGLSAGFYSIQIQIGDRAETKKVLIH